MAAQLLTDTKIAEEIARMMKARVEAKKAGAPMPQGSRRALPDSKVRGLVLRITTGGTATWVLVYRPNGSAAPYRLMLGHYPDLGLGDARDLAEIKRGEIAKGADPVKTKREQKAAGGSSRAPDVPRRCRLPRRAHPQGEEPAQAASDVQGRAAAGAGQHAA